MPAKCKKNWYLNWRVLKDVHSVLFTPNTKDKIRFHHCMTKVTSSSYNSVENMRLSVFYNMINNHLVVERYQYIKENMSRIKINKHSRHSRNTVQQGLLQIFILCANCA